jgi:hypothetical protein
MPSQFPISSLCPFERNKGVGCNSLYCGLGHLSKTFFRLEMGKMMINKKPTQDKVQKHIANWTITKKKQSTEVNMGNEKNLQ